MALTMNKQLPSTIQDEILDILEVGNDKVVTKAIRFRQARIVVRLRNKYNFRRNRLGLN